MKPPQKTPAPMNQEVVNGHGTSAARALPAGACLDDFEIGEIIGEGSAAIVYAATDRALAVPVAIAEYMPARIARRGDAGQVTPRAAAQADVFAKGLNAFIKETRTLARCDHPSLVRFMRLWEASGTAYRVMPRYPARRLLEARRSMLEPPGEEAVRALLEALLGALGAFHDTGGFHGKVTPSNILLLDDTRPLLLSGGAASRAIASDRIDAGITGLEPAFAPIEQILESADAPLPPSVDLYALAGVARYWITGQLPAPALRTRDTARREALATAVQRLCMSWPRLHYSASLVDALESAVSIYPAERPQSVAEMRERLGSAPPVANGLVGPPWTAAPVFSDAGPSSPVPPDAAIAFASDSDPSATARATRFHDDPSARTVFARQTPNPRRMALWGATMVVLLALLSLGVYEFHAERQIGRMLDVLGISRGTGAGDTAVSESAAGPAALVRPAIPADAEPAKAMPTEPAAVDVGTASSPAGAVAATPPASADRATPTAADSAPTTESAAMAEPLAPSRPPTRVTEQNASRAPSSPREVCGARTDFSLYRCMQAQCSQRQWASHPQCERLRTDDSVD